MTKAKPKLLHYCKNISSCNCYKNMLNKEFQTFSTGSKSQFADKYSKMNADICVICACGTTRLEIVELIHNEVVQNQRPALICAKRLQPQLINASIRAGVELFLCCEVENEDNREIIWQAVRQIGLREFLDRRFPGIGTSPNPTIQRLIDEVVGAFPRRMKITELTHNLGIGRSWIQVLCRRTFGMTYTQFIRCIWLYQALNLMKNTTLTNTEIAYELVSCL